MPFHIPLSCASTNQWSPSSFSSTRGASSFHLSGACDDHKSGGRYVRSMWLSPEINFSGMAGSSCSLCKGCELCIVRSADYQRYRLCGAPGARLICVSMPMIAPGLRKLEGEAHGGSARKRRVHLRGQRELGEGAGG